MCLGTTVIMGGAMINFDCQFDLISKYLEDEQYSVICVFVSIGDYVIRDLTP